jgi:hypothetical protein
MTKIKNTLFLLIAAAVMLSCGLFNLGRNEDGTYRVETTLPLSVIESAIKTSSELTNVLNLEMELREGYIYLHADSIQIEGTEATDVTMHLRLSAVNGKLSARMTNVEVSGLPVDESLFKEANEMLAQQLEEASQQAGKASLEDVSISPDGVHMVWRIDPN